MFLIHFCLMPAADDSSVDSIVVKEDRCILLVEAVGGSNRLKSAQNTSLELLLLQEKPCTPQTKFQD